jgi:short-subunit dehydrogenase
MNPELASVLLTGASGGIGAELARLLVQSGARVLLAGRSRERLLALANELQPQAMGRDRVDALVVDVTTEAGRRALIDTAQVRRVNVLINNAGMPCFGPAQQVDAQMLERLFQTNVVAPMLLTAGLLPHLLTQPGALVLNVGSVLGDLGIPGYGAYGASKAALRNYSESLRRELQGTHVKVLYAAPRAVHTAFNDSRVQAFNQATGTHADMPQVVARRLLNMLLDETPQRTFGFPESFAVVLNRLLPRMLDKVFVRHQRALGSLAATEPVNQLDH